MIDYVNSLGGEIRGKANAYLNPVQCDIGGKKKQRQRFQEVIEIIKDKMARQKPGECIGSLGDNSIERYQELIFCHVLDITTNSASFNPRNHCHVAKVDCLILGSSVWRDACGRVWLL